MPSMKLMPRAEFEKVMIAALKSMPKKFRDKLDNVAILIEEKGPRNLLGLYEGIPLQERMNSCPAATPDRITLYKRNLEEMCGGNKTRLLREIKKTLIHEIAHLFGMEDNDLEKYGL